MVRNVFVSITQDYQYVSYVEKSVIKERSRVMQRISGRFSIIHLCQCVNNQVA
jgi:hypothetical protein